MEMIWAGEGGRGRVLKFNGIFLQPKERRGARWWRNGSAQFLKERGAGAIVLFLLLFEQKREKDEDEE
jgi:hypothetical protein